MKRLLLTCAALIMFTATAFAYKVGDIIMVGGEMGVVFVVTTDGQHGKDGYTPQRGTDYWTSSDKLEIFKAVYPVGAIYLSTVATNPATLFGFGTWEQVKDTFLLAAGSTYAAGSTGGSATHTLTVDELPSHEHAAKGWAAVRDGSGTYITLGGAGKSREYTTDPTGGGTAHNNMPPYLAVYMWKRTA